MEVLNPTLADGLWTWRQQLTEAAIVLSALEAARGVSAARELARDLAEPGRTVVLAGLGAAEPLFWNVPAGKELDTVRPDVVLLLVQNRFTPSVRLLLATANHVFLLAGTSDEERAESLKAMQMVVRYASPSHVEIVVVAESPSSAREAGAPLLTLAKNRFANRAACRHVPSARVAQPANEEGPMAVGKTTPLPLSDAELRARNWDESFRRAEKLLAEAQETLRRQLARPPAPPPDRAAARQPTSTL